MQVTAFRVALVTAAMAMSNPAAAQQTLESAQGEVTAVLIDFEGNLIEMESIEMNTRDWLSRYNPFKQRLDSLNRQITELSAYCQGTFAEPEYTRRKTYCDGTGSQLDSQMAQLKPEQENLLAQGQTLQTRDAARQQAGEKLKARLQVAVEHLVMACIALPREQLRARCHFPAPPGPRTAPMVAAMEASLTGDIAKFEAEKAH